METAFDLLDKTARSNYLRLLMQSFHCTYVCFWSFVPTPLNCLRGQDGMYEEELNSQMPSSSSGSFAQRLFYEYQQSTFVLHPQNDHIPGFAFKNSIPYSEFQELQLRTLASNDIQRQFYQEARIKMAVFLGCKNGEIELGLSNVPTDKMKMEIQSLFLREDYHQITTQPSQQQAYHDQVIQINNIPNIPIVHYDHQNPQNYSSSSSSLRSLSNIDSPESLLFNLSNNNATSTSTTTTNSNNTNNNSNTNYPSLEAVQAFARLQNPKFPSPTAEEEAMTKAILAVLSSSLPPLPPYGQYPSTINTRSSAFKTYNAPKSASTSYLGRKKSMFKQSIAFFRHLNMNMRNRQGLQISRPNNPTQLHHMMSERKRREKLNESFLALRSLLPPGTKKDKASMLNATKEYLSSLKAQIEGLSQRNKQLEAQIIVPSKRASKREDDNHTLKSHSPTDHQRAIDVQLRHVSESMHETQIFDLEVIQRESNAPLDDLVLSLLNFLKRLENVSLVSLEANSSNESSTTPINRLILRLRVLEGNEWDKSAFQEAVRRVVANLAQLN